MSNLDRNQSSNILSEAIDRSRRQKSLSPEEVIDNLFGRQKKSSKHYTKKQIKEVICEDEVPQADQRL